MMKNLSQIYITKIKLMDSYHLDTTKAYCFLGKIYESIIIKDETYFADNLSEQHKYQYLPLGMKIFFLAKFKFYINYFDNLRKSIFLVKRNITLIKCLFIKELNLNLKIRLIRD